MMKTANMLSQASTFSLRDCSDTFELTQSRLPPYQDAANLRHCSRSRPMIPGVSRYLCHMSVRHCYGVRTAYLMQDTNPSVERAPKLGRKEKQPFQRAGLNILPVAKIYERLIPSTTLWMHLTVRSYGNV